MQMVWRVLESIWFSAFLTTVFFVACPLGGLACEVLGGLLVLGVAVLWYAGYKLWEMIQRESPRRQSYLIATSIWAAVILLGACVLEVKDTDRALKIGLLPLLLGVKYMQVNSHRNPD